MSQTDQATTIRLQLRSGNQMDCEKVVFSPYAHQLDIYEEGRYTRSLPIADVREISSHHG